ACRIIAPSEQHGIERVAAGEIFLVIGQAVIVRSWLASEGSFGFSPYATSQPSGIRSPSVSGLNGSVWLTRSSYAVVKPSESSSTPVPRIRNALAAGRFVSRYVAQFVPCPIQDQILLITGFLRTAVAKRS